MPTAAQALSLTEAAGDNAGWSVSSAGDVNGDGIDDLIIGAYLADPIQLNIGKSYVVFGQDGGFGSNIDLESWRQAWQPRFCC